MPLPRATDFQVETVTGQAQVLQLFEVTGKKRGSESITVIAGCKVWASSLSRAPQLPLFVDSGGSLRPHYLISCCLLSGDSRVHTLAGVKGIPGA